ncbi:transferase [Trypanosoma rangeli]|uniref:Transferase n=1 Tax=Trypanosoma rangeli TaxID=5698 RepID=A0A3R7K298_TRYRA|nr:transferase [Trypanosoma rangeli]RNF00525.1 transferase [Trypanosoma rangeli]|eukprot:RNF00525.1 transferase [Trypanosoma rangeli]
MLLSDENAAMLAKYYRTVQLTGEQKDLLIEKYWEANKEERSEIARAYSALFATDATFVQRLMAYYDTHVALLNRGKANGRHDGGGDEGREEGNLRLTPPPIEDDEQQPPHHHHHHHSHRRLSRGTKSGGAAPLSHAQLLLRTAIQDQYPKLTGDGPFPISFGIVQTEEERREAVGLYSTQFQYPDPPELQRLVILPQSHSTRTRRRAKGDYTWYIRSQTSKEMVCAATIKAHHYDTQRFVEVPLFATGVGYKKMGFGRLLNAALLEWCVEAGFEFVMISADVQAIPFWSHLGYATMSKSELTRIAFYYEHNCYKFKGAEAMIRYLKAQPLHSVQASLERMPKIVVMGPLSLPNP